MQCMNCGSGKTKLNKKSKTPSGIKHQYKCQSCQSYFTVSYQADDGIQAVKSNTLRYVITSAQNNVETNLSLFGALKRYCKENDAKLMVIPTKYIYGLDGDEVSYCSHVTPYLLETIEELHPKLRVMGPLRLPTTAVNPLAGLDGMTKGKSLIVGHAQLQMKTLPVQSDDLPVIITTTGTVSERYYSPTKAGFKADFNHSFGALVVEVDEDQFHIRNLNFDGKGFYDIDRYYTASDVTKVTQVEALVTGDEHAIFFSPEVKAATYTNSDSIVATLRPNYIVRHDLLDCFAVSHHHKGRTITNFMKHKNGLHKIEDELKKTIDHVLDTTPQFSTNIIVASNHNDHLSQWLNSCDPREEPWNALFYHSMMYQILGNVSFEGKKVNSANPFQLYAEPILEQNGVKAVFLSRSQSFKLHGIELACHGDAGNNGARGSKGQFANLPAKMIVGHTHSPSIEKSCYTVGTSSHLELEYTKGPSSWLNSHCVIYPNGKRQLIHIINGKWRAK